MLPFLRYYLVFFKETGANTFLAEEPFHFSVQVVTESEQRFVGYIIAGALIFTGGALVYEHRKISKLKVSGEDLKEFICE